MAPDKLDAFLCACLVFITISGKGEQRLFVPHNGLECRDVSSRGRRIGRILKMPLAVLREVARMYRSSIRIQFHASFGIALAPLGRIHRCGIFLLEHLRILAVSHRVIQAVLLDLVDKEQRKYLDAARGKLELTLQMVLDGALDLRALDSFGGNITNGLTKLDVFAVLELDPFVASSGGDVAHNPAGLIVGILATLVKQVVTRLDVYLFALLRTILLAHINCQLGCNGRGDLCRLKPHVRAIQVLLREHRIDGDALDQSTLKGINRRQAIDFVVRLFMGCRVTQHKQRIQASNSLFAFSSRVNALRLVDDDDRIA